MSYEAPTMANNNNMRLSYNNNNNNNADGYSSLNRPSSPNYNNNPNGGGATNSLAVDTSGMDGDVVKRKRGRPRKYPRPEASNSPAPMLPPGHVAETGEGSGPGKKPRGRPPGSLNKQQFAASGSPGVGFMPHILEVKPGEDVLSQVMWYSQNSNRALCVMSANGAVSNVTLRQSATSGATVTYEGRFEILSLSGSFMVTEVGGQRSRTGGLSVSLSGPDGRVLGGNVSGLLIAASPVQVIVGSFVTSSPKQARAGGNNKSEVVNATQSESSGGGLGSPLGGHSNNSGNPQGMANMPWR